MIYGTGTSALVTRSLALWRVAIRLSKSSRWVFWRTDWRTLILDAWFWRSIHAKPKWHSEEWGCWIRSWVTFADIHSWQGFFRSGKGICMIIRNYKILELRCQQAKKRQQANKPTRQQAYRQRQKASSGQQANQPIERPSASMLGTSFLYVSCRAFGVIISEWFDLSRCLEGFGRLHSLKLTFLPLKIGRNPIGKACIPTIHL